MTDFEDEPPCIHHRSQFDTLPAPPDAHVLKDSRFKVTRRGRELLAECGLDLPADGVLEFAGGDVPLPKPTRADLILSAKQWAKSVRDCYIDEFYDVVSPAAETRMSGKLDRLDAVLAELAAMEEK